MTETIDPTVPNVYYKPITAVTLEEQHWSEKCFGEYKLTIVQGTYGSGTALNAEDAGRVRDAIDAILLPLEAPSMKTELEQLIEIMCKVRWDEHMRRLKVPAPRPWEDAPAENRIAFREAILPMAIAAYNFLGKRKGK